MLGKKTFAKSASKSHTYKFEDRGQDAQEAMLLIEAAISPKERARRDAVRAYAQGALSSAQSPTAGPSSDGTHHPAAPTLHTGVSVITGAAGAEPNGQQDAVINVQQEEDDEEAPAQGIRALLNDFRRYLFG